ncbi:hypothetical protein GCM10027176_34500 [Actinoallomurus bryophytorum]|uniref:Uncharacterized protein n=1 Tax=Actinoallomurus bryophytorum TaxID=1490222 RepID=A0A543CVU1_9ACTN|nr:hypothetical protein FB559_6961 [Actinoallomurus bryophytorum]
MAGFGPPDAGTTAWLTETTVYKILFRACFDTLKQVFTSRPEAKGEVFKPSVSGWRGGQPSARALR